MNRDILLLLYRFHIDANQTVMDTVALLTLEAFTSESSPSHGSIQQLLRHILGADIYFPALCAGDPPSFAEIETIVTGLDSADAFRAHWETVNASALAALESLDDGDMDREVTITFGEHSFDLPVWQMIVQQIAHAHMHRGELSILLSEAGHPLPAIDLMVHFINTSGQHWPF